MVVQNIPNQLQRRRNAKQSYPVDSKITLNLTYVSTTADIAITVEAALFPEFLLIYITQTSHGGSANELVALILLEGSENFIVFRLFRDSQSDNDKSVWLWRLISENETKCSQKCRISLIQTALDN